MVNTSFIYYHDQIDSYHEVTTIKIYTFYYRQTLQKVLSSKFFFKGVCVDEGGSVASSVVQ